MSAQSDSLEIVHEGWLTKSPPTKSIWRARWRKRWFVLRHSGELPGQYFLCYYTDKNCRKLKGRIDLDQCEQVDAGLRFENRKQKYQHMFDVRTPKRTYYLAAETEEEMNKWVDCVCQVCGLKAFCQFDTTTYYEFTGGDEENPSLAEESSQAAESPPISPTSTASGPYIPISECISGKPLSSPDGLSHFLALQHKQNLRNETYDAPRRLQPPELELRNSGSTTPPLQSPATDGESVFTDEEWTNPNPKPSVNWETFPRPSDSSADGDTPRPSSMVTVGKRFTRNLDDVIIPVAPPRPPKPLHLIANENSHSYSNIEDITNGEDKKTDVINDETYDFPRSHNINGENVEGSEFPVPQARHCYTNAAPGKVNGDVFRYDLAHTTQLLHNSSKSEPISPSASESSPVVLYSNLPSPAVSLTTPPAAPPVVNRGLKPGRKDSIVSNEPSPIATLPAHPPSIDRKLKPVPAVRKKIDLHDDGTHGNILKLSAPPLGRLVDGSQSLRRPRAAPSPVPPSQRRNSDTSDDLHLQVCFYDRGAFGGSRRDEIQYLDLALDSSDTSLTLPNTPPGALPVTPSPTVYKTVDFLKTEAFNRTREKVEQERKGKGEKPVH